MYVLHFDRPYLSGHHPGARHYVGIALDGDVQRRLRQHLKGQGSPLVEAVVRAGIAVRVVLDVPGDRRLERRWHQRHGSRVCPECAIRRPRTRQLRLWPAAEPAMRLSHAASV